MPLETVTAPLNLRRQLSAIAGSASPITGFKRFHGLHAGFGILCPINGPQGRHNSL
jgi:hypothetical protein